MATKDEKLRYVIEALWRGGSATDQARKGIREVGKAAKDTDTEVKKAGQGLAGFGKELLALTGISLSVAGGVAVIQQGFEALKQGADNLLIEDKFERLAATVGATADSMLDDLQGATGGIISDMQLMASATDILSLGLAKNRDDTVRLATVIGELGLDMQQVTLTLANNSKARLDSLGLSVEGVTKRTNELVAAGKDANEAFDLAVLEGLEARVELLGSASETTAGQIKILETAWRNFVDAAKADLAGSLAPTIEAISGAYADQLQANVKAADSLRDLKQLGQEMQRDLANLGGGFFAWGGDLQNDFRRAALEDALVSVVDEMARGTGSAKEFRAALIDAFGPDAIQRIDNMGTEIIALAGGMGNYEQRWRDAQPTLAQFTKGLEDLARAGRMVAQEGMRTPDMPFDALAIEQSIALYDDMALASERAAIMAERGFAKAAGSAGVLRDALMETRKSMGAGFLEFFDTDLLQKEFGKYVTVVTNNSEQIAEIEATLQGDLTKAQEEAYKERLKLIEERSNEAARLRERLRGDLSADERDELLAELKALEEANGQLRRVWDVDENMAQFAGVMLETAAGAGAAGKALLELAGNSDAAREALTNAAFKEKADELGRAVASGAITARDAMQQLADFMDGFDLDAFLKSESNLGAESFGEKAKREMLALVEGIDTTAATAASKVDTAATDAETALTDLQTGLQKVEETDPDVEITDNFTEVQEKADAFLSTVNEIAGERVLLFRIVTEGEVPELPPPGTQTAVPIPGKAMGGPVLPGQPYVVGEKGPELFIPGAAGTVVPNQAASGGSPAGSSVNVNLFINMTPQGGMTPGQFATQVAGIMNDQLAKMMAT